MSALTKYMVFSQNYYYTLGMDEIKEINKDYLRHNFPAQLLSAGSFGLTPIIMENDV